jgi:hypothetical protein
MSFLEFLNACQKSKIHFTLQDEQLKVNAPKDILTTETISYIRLFKTQIIAELTKKILSAESEKPPLELYSRGHHRARASIGQEQLWLAQQLNKHSDIYHFVREVSLFGDVSVAAIVNSFSKIVMRHETLRTVFFSENGTLFQCVNKADAFNLPLIDLCHIDKKSKHVAKKDALKLFTHKSFNLSRDLMLRAQLIQLSEKEFSLCIAMHHIASDGWSLGVLVNEFQQNYNHDGKAAVNEIPSLPFQYADYSDWVADNRLDRISSTSAKFWQKTLADAPINHGLPRLENNLSTTSFLASDYHSTLEEETTGLLQRLARTNSCTLFSTLETLFHLFISSYSSTNDVVIGTVVANREYEQLEGHIGYFVNLVPLRHKVNFSDSFKQHLVKSHQEIVNAFSHQNTPFSEIIKTINAEGSRSNNPLIQIAFILQNNEMNELQLNGLQCQVNEVDKAFITFELMLEASIINKGLELRWSFANELFSEQMVSTMSDHFNQFINEVVSDIDRPLNDINFLNDEEINQQLITWNDTKASYPDNICIHQLFEQQAQLHPDNVALVFEDKTLTYQALNAQANQLAAYLKVERNITPDTLVGICVVRSLEMVIGILAILKAGGAYVPIDPDYPKAR